MLVLLLVIFSLCLNHSQQDLLYDLALDQGLNFTEAEAVFEYGKHGIKRQATYTSRFGITQTNICGINGKTLSRLRRQNKPENYPQGSLDWPWMAVFLTKNTGEWFCGGVLLNSRYVLSAAHCFSDKVVTNKKDVYVRLGEYDLTDQGETGIQNFQLEEIMIHEYYDPGNFQNDIAIIRLNQTVRYTQFVRPICLPRADPRPGENTIVAGWGRTADDNQKSHLLLYVDVPIWDLAECKDVMSHPIFTTNICAAPEFGGKDSCEGDSGGPLMYQANSKRWETIGIVSWGFHCGETRPGVYTSVFQFLPWIGRRILNASP